MSTKVDLSGERKPYLSEDVKNVFPEKDPFKLFDAWFAIARNTDGIKGPYAMALATADASGVPSVRYLSLKSYGRDGFHFCTNYESRKGKEMAENPHVALLFYWEPLCRQVRIEGTVVKLDEKESEKYFRARELIGQITVVLSHESQVIESRDVLLQKHKELEAKYSDENVTIPKPAYWGAYKVIPQAFEFWCGRTNRLHDRIRFRLPASQEVTDEKFTHSGENGWVYEYLAP